VNLEDRVKQLEVLVEDQQEQISALMAVLAEEDIRKAFALNQDDDAEIRRAERAKRSLLDTIDRRIARHLMRAWETFLTGDTFGVHAHDYAVMLAKMSADKDRKEYAEQHERRRRAQG